MFKRSLILTLAFFTAYSCASIDNVDYTNHSDVFTNSEEFATLLDARISPFLNTNKAQQLTKESGITSSMIHQFRQESQQVRSEMKKQFLTRSGSPEKVKEIEKRILSPSSIVVRDYLDSRRVNIDKNSFVIALENFQRAFPEVSRKELFEELKTRTRDRIENIRNSR